MSYGYFLQRFWLRPVFLRIVWICCALAVLGLTLWLDGSGENSDAMVLFLGGMLLLCAPISFLVVGGFVWLIQLQEWSGIKFLDVLGVRLGGVVLLWVVLMLAGYLQWFYLVPALRSRLAVWRGKMARK